MEAYPHPNSNPNPNPNPKWLFGVGLDQPTPPHSIPSY